MSEEKKILQRNMSDRTVAGVCSGLADYMNLDVTLVRAAFVVLALIGGGGVLVYAVLWVIMPRSDAAV